MVFSWKCNPEEDWPRKGKYDSILAKMDYLLAKKDYYLVFSLSH